MFEFLNILENLSRRFNNVKYVIFLNWTQLVLFFTHSTKTCRKKKFLKKGPF